MSLANHSQFLRDCQSKGIPLEQSSAKIKANLVEYEREIPGCLYPRHRDDVKTIVALANEHQVALFPLSSGKNWGFGSKMPAKDGAVIVDLMALNRIIKIDHELGYAVIEPGVTQRQLSEALAESKSPYFLDVTGSSPDTSIIGNSLERGIGYNELRVKTLGCLEVVLGSGNVVKTGFGHFEIDSDVTHLYPYGIGPNLDALFFQSNFGIVLSGTIQLLRRPGSIAHLTLFIKDEKKVPDVILKLSKLKEKNLISGIPHVFSRERADPGMAGMLYYELKQRGQDTSETNISSYLDSKFSGEWTVSACMMGSPLQVFLAGWVCWLQLFRFGMVLIMTDGWHKYLSWFSGLFGFRKWNILLSVFKRIRHVPIGKPLDEFVASVHWPVTKELDSVDLLEPDEGDAGFVYSAPFAAATPEAVEKMLDLTNQVAKQHGFTAAVTLNLVTTKLVEGVISISYSRSAPEIVKKAKQCIRDMNIRFNKEGMFPYRADIDSMDIFVNDQDVFWKTCAAIGKVLDPKGIIAPGRYSL